MSTEPEHINPSHAVTRYEGGNYAVAAPLGVNEILAQVKLIQEVMGKVMQEGEHYGTIPGCGEKKTLLQPGAQKLTMTFRLGPTYEIQETNLPSFHKEYRVICTLRSVQSGTLIGQGVGVCSTMESKYRFRGGSRKCPHCGKEAIIKGKAEYGGGWLCFAKKGGCGAKWADGAAEIESQSIERIEHDNPADHFNTVLKMAKKRAFVDATITATAASDIFTQDIGEDEDPPDAPKPPQKSPKLAEKPPKPSKNAPEPADDNWLEGFLQRCKEKIEKYAKGDLKWAWWKVMVDKGVCLPTETMEEVPAASYFRLSPELSRDDIMQAVPKIFMSYQSAVQALVDNITPEQGKEIDSQFAAAYAKGDKGTTSSEQPAFSKSTEEGKAATRSETTMQNEPAKSAKSTAAKKPASQPKSTKLTERDDEWWRDVVVPIPHKGESRKEYLENPETIGQLYDLRHEESDEGQEARQRLWGFVNHYEAKPWTGKDGKERPPSKTDTEFREALDAFNDWFEQTHPDEKL